MSRLPCGLNPAGSGSWPWNPSTAEASPAARAEAPTEGKAWRLQAQKAGTARVAIGLAGIGYTGKHARKLGASRTWTSAAFPGLSCSATTRNLCFTPSLSAK